MRLHEARSSADFHFAPAGPSARVAHQRVLSASFRLTYARVSSPDPESVMNRNRSTNPLRISERTFAARRVMQLARSDRQNEFLFGVRKRIVAPSACQRFFEYQISELP